jgi:hypothetical protein
MTMENVERLRAYYRLVDYRETILTSIGQIEKILKEEFPSEFPLAYQHWIPQIKTAITEDSRWLSRTDYNFDYTLNKIDNLDKTDEEKCGVRKFI